MPSTQRQNDLSNHLTDIGGVHDNVFAPHNLGELDRLDKINQLDAEIGNEVTMINANAAKKMAITKNLEKKLLEQKSTMQDGLTKLLAVRETIQAEKKEKQKELLKISVQNKLEELKQKLEKKEKQNKKPTKTKVINTHKGSVTLHPLSRQDKNNRDNGQLKLKTELNDEKELELELERLEKLESLKNAKENLNPVQQTIQAGLKASTLGQIATPSITKPQPQINPPKEDKKLEIKPEIKLEIKPPLASPSPTLSTQSQENPTPIATKGINNTTEQAKFIKPEVNNLDGIDTTKAQMVIDNKAEREVDYYKQVVYKTELKDDKNAEKEKLLLHTSFGTFNPKLDKNEDNKNPSQASNPLERLAQLKKLKKQAGNKLESLIEAENSLHIEMRVLKKIIEIAEGIQSLSGLKVVREMERMVLDVIAVNNQPVNLAVLNEYGKLVEKSLHNWQNELNMVIKSYGKTNQIDKDLNFISLHNQENFNNKTAKDKHPVLNQVKEQFWQKWQEKLLKSGIISGNELNFISPII